MVRDDRLQPLGRNLVRCQLQPAWNGFLREELGMRGMCITDFSGSSQYMDLVDGLIAGSDICSSLMPEIHTTKAANYEHDAYIVTQMRSAMHHILYTVVQLQRHERLSLQAIP